MTTPGADQQGRKRCAGCNTPIARDHLDDDYCSSCQRKLRSGDAASPHGRRPAPQPDVVDAVAELLMRRLGQSLDLGEILGEDSRTIAAAVRRLKDHRFLIKGDRARGGYVCDGWHDPRRQGRYCYRGHRKGCAPGPPEDDEVP